MSIFIVMQKPENFYSVKFENLRKEMKSERITLKIPYSSLRLCGGFLLFKINLWIDIQCLESGSIGVSRILKRYLLIIPHYISLQLNIVID